MENNKVPSNAEEQSKSTAGFTFPPIIQKQLSKAFMEIKPGTKIGEFTINEKIGSGGLGDVYKAELAGTTKKFAIKIVQPDKANDALIERFNQERTTLGNLDHPNIVNITYTGNYQGLPYFAMELVDGLHITKYADKNNLTIKKRLALFLQVCDAVKYAHEQGVIHRDLKPANILVTEREQGEPLVKMIDFGIAKILNENLNREYTTQIGHPIGTLEYMSPEQTGQNLELVDESSDIYSLGAVLYELLVGELPLDLQGERKDKIETIRESEPQNPSARISAMEESARNRIAVKRGVDPSQLQKMLKGSVGRAVMKCLEKEQENRFKTVSSLTNEIKHFLKPKTRLSVESIVTFLIITILLLATIGMIASHIGNTPETLTSDDISTPDGIIKITINSLNNAPSQ